MEKMINNDELSLRIAEAISPHRKRSERFVGMVPYTLHFEIRKYSGTSRKPEKVNVLDKTVINLIGRGVHDLPTISKKLGFDILYDLDREILLSNVDYIKKDLQFITGDDRNLSLTSIGKTVYETGEFVREVQSKFELYVIPEYTYYPALKECLAGHPSIIKGKRETKDEDLSLDQIRFIAESQASHVQHTESNLNLIGAELKNYIGAEVSIYVCFLQSVRDNSVRTIIYDASTNSVISLLSTLFDSNTTLRDSLLRQCLKNEVEEEEVVKVESGDKPQEQIQAEENLLQEVEEKGEDVSEGDENYKTVGSIYDSAEFEKELHEIFEHHQNEEIWLISPWIRKYAFIRKREPKIRKFLDQGGTIFIGYSEPEKLGEEMVDPDSMSVVKRLDANYDRFYYAELPKFHYKNVIEHKDKQTTLYTGSFNILSFCINDNEEHYRMEQMMLANEDSAVKTRNSYLQQFAKQYIERFVVKVDSMKEGTTLKAAKLKYFDSCDVLNDKFQLLSEKAKEKSVTIDLNAVSEISREELVDIAMKILNLPYQDERYYIQSLLSALLYLFDNAKVSNDTKAQNTIEQRLHRLVQRNSIFKICRFGMRRGYEDERKTVVRIICNNINFEFGDIALPKNIFALLNKHKEIFNFKEANITTANRNLKQILYNSAKAVLKDEL